MPHDLRVYSSHCRQPHLRIEERLGCRFDSLLPNSALIKIWLAGSRGPRIGKFWKSPDDVLENLTEHSERRGFEYLRFRLVG